MGLQLRVVAPVGARLGVEVRVRVSVRARDSWVWSAVGPAARLMVQWHWYWWALVVVHCHRDIGTGALALLLVHWHWCIGYGALGHRCWCIGCWCIVPRSWLTTGCRKSHPTGGQGSEVRHHHAGTFNVAGLPSLTTGATRTRPRGACRSCPRAPCSQSRYRCRRRHGRLRRRCFCRCCRR